MDSMTYLENTTIHDVLVNFTRDEAISFRTIVEKTLEDFSVGGERAFQPEPSGVSRPNGQRTLFRPFTSDNNVGAKLVVEPPTKPDGKKDPLRGIIVICDGLGVPTGVLDAEEVTGYRTSMNVMVPFSFRKHVDNIVIFGGGMQALWHTRLILTLRGHEVKSITYVSPIENQVHALVSKITEENSARWGSNASFYYIDTTAPDFQEKIEKRLSDADAIFTTTPSRAPLFPARYLTSRPKASRQPFISAIGSWQSDMIELDPGLLHHALQVDDNYNPNGQTGGAVLVDDRDYALVNSGEVVQSKVTAEDLVEVGYVLSLLAGRTASNAVELEKTNHWVSEGFLVYKSIGVSLTDLTVANAIVNLIKKKGVRL